MTIDQYREKLQFELNQYRLGNGLTVLMHHDDSVPIVAVDLWYHVGSSSEKPSRTGLAHLVEHLMFEGSAGHDCGYFGPLQEAGGSVNGSTSKDRTNYYEVVPSHFLELALWMEADRMANLVPVLTPEKLENQRSVVQNERRQHYENQPYGRVSEEISRLLYPPEHSYSWPVIGSLEHMSEYSMEDVHGFFEKFYHPANAVLSVVGSFEEAPARDWIEKYFAPIPAGPHRRRPSVSPRGMDGKVPAFDTERRLKIQDEVALSRLDLVWPTVPRLHEDEPALDFAAEILAGRSKDSRLNRKLVREHKLATTVGAYGHTLELTGQFGIQVYSLPGKFLDKIESITLEELALLRNEMPTADEIERVRCHFLNLAYAGVETVLGKADLLNHYLFYQGDVSHSSFLSELESYQRVSAEDVRQVAQKYLGPGRVVIEVVPQTGEKTLSPSREPAEESRGEKSKGSGPAAALPGPGKPRLFRLPTIERSTARCGLRIALVRWPKLPRIDFQLLLDAGATCEPDEKLGLSRLTADVLDEGTTSRDGLEIARQLDRIGARMSVSMGSESATVVVRTLRSNMTEAFELLADVVRNPLFDETDLSRERDRLLGELAYHKKQPASMADKAIAAAIFGAEHPYGRPIDGDETLVAAIEPTDLAGFHSANYHPHHATLLVVGDANISEVEDLVEKSFADWQADRQPKNKKILTMPELGQRQFLVIERPDAVQSVIRVGKLGPARHSPDFFSLLLLNTVLGGQFSSRLNLKLREEKGFTYGAHSSFRLRRAGGSFVAGTDVQSTSTHETVAEILGAISAPAGESPITTEELAFAKAYLSRRFPARFETCAGIAAHLAQLAIYDLPDDFYDQYLPSIDAVTLESIHEAARTHLSSEGINVVVVGNPTDAQALGELGLSRVDPPIDGEKPRFPKAGSAANSS